jgi:Flp pilus assembly protein CpaB
MAPSLTVNDVRRAVSRHRGLLAAGLAAGAIASALGVLAPRPPAGVPVLTVTRDLAAGTALAAADLDRTELPRGLAPAGALVSAAEVVGRVLAAPVRRGEALTDVRLAGADLLTSRGAGLVAVPVRVADAASAALVTAGDHVDVLAAGSSGGAPSARVVAVDAEVLAVPTAVQDGGDGALIVVAASPPVAASLAAAAVSSRLSLTLRARR